MSHSVGQSGPKVIGIGDHESWRVTLGANRDGRLEVRHGLGEHLGGKRHERLGQAVTHSEFVALNALVNRQMLGDTFPAVVGPCTGGLGDVADDRHGSTE